ncbi:hypothetical protein KIH45_14595 [Croceicoccus sp. 1NDH52]|nr:hypothetical protein [Croceicoccus gelatinilyticus]MBS7670972.1 hypothetical protein [Croceicoccus gelatinilyticus]
MAKPRGGNRHSGKIEAYGDCIRELIAEQGHSPGRDSGAADRARRRRRIETTYRFFVVTGSRAKKTGHAIEQDRPKVLRQREHWFGSQIDLEPERLVFIEET